MDGLLMTTAGALAGAAIAVAVRRRLEAARRASEEARVEGDRQAFVGTLAAGLAHEMRNPLSTLRMHLELLKEDWAQPVTEREKAGSRRLDGILKETKRLEDTLAGFLRFAVNQELRREPVNLEILARDLADFLAPRLSSLGLRLDAAVARDVPVVQADPGLLRNAVLNLLLNACEASPPGGAVGLRVTRDAAEVAIEVSDQGAGIPAEHLDRIFEAYFSTKPAGTGLGLPTARRIVEQHGGRLEVRSTPGRGSVFTLRLPA